jgi:5-oxoprolinase (ATP-hydrolysing) subunit A
MKFIDLNCDMGEFPEAVFGGTQESLMPHLTSVNIACGGHAGDERTMRATVEQALRHHVAIGAHPGYADRAHFGRIELHLPENEIADSVFQQVSALARIAAACGVAITHVKPHGALYNQAARDPAIARAIAEGVSRWRTGVGSTWSPPQTTTVGSTWSPPQTTDVVLVGLSGSQMLDAFRHAGFPAAAEAFADRRYEPDGSLRSRKFPDALIADPAEAARQAVQIAEHGTVTAHDGTTIAVGAQTICIHGDTPGAPQIAAAAAQALRAAGITPHALQNL